MGAYDRVMAHQSFEVVCEIEPATTPDLTRVRHQIGMMAPVASSFLIPDNHIGRATVSSVAVAHEVQAMGGRAVACLNARDRNLLGFERDLLTAAAYGVEEFLFVYGDKPTSGGRTSELTVRSMLEHARAATESAALAGARPFRLGATTRLTSIPPWKQAADFVFVQVGFSLDRLLAWRETVEVDADLYAGVMVVASAPMARRLIATVPDIEVPDDLVRRIESNPEAGIDLALDLIDGIEASGAFAGVHLVPVSRYRQVAARLEQRRS
jgi:methylenetetrahydrofolate reductase (NADPH)